MLHRLLAAALLATLPLAAHAVPPPPWQGKLHPCTLPDGGGKGFCGTYDVFENREARSGRKIALKIVVLPAKGQYRAPDPVFFLEGGPGAGAARMPVSLPATGRTCRSSIRGRSRPRHPCRVPERASRRR